MVYGFVEKSKQRPTWYEMLHAILRNFGGLDQVNPVMSFKKNLSRVVHFDGMVRILFSNPLMGSGMHVCPCPSIAHLART
jgi:hypothetical protein